MYREIQKLAATKQKAGTHCTTLQATLTHNMTVSPGVPFSSLDDGDRYGIQPLTLGS